MRPVATRGRWPRQTLPRSVLSATQEDAEHGAATDAADAVSLLPPTTAVTDHRSLDNFQTQKIIIKNDTRWS